MVITHGSDCTNAMMESVCDRYINQHEGLRDIKGQAP
jgi:hypothetical protein